MPFEEAELRKYMQECIELARRHHPDSIRPYVGALVLSSSKEIVGRGHKSFVDGTSFIVHAERMALDEANEKAKGGYLFTTLEPCAQRRRKQVFAPCAELIVERGIVEVVIGLIDNSSQMQPFQGIGYLENRGVRLTQYPGLKEIIKDEFMSKHYVEPTVRGL